MKKEDKNKKNEVSRRGFLAGLSGAAGLVLASKASGSDVEIDKKTYLSKTEISPALNPRERAERAYELRVKAAQKQRQIPFPEIKSNNDENLYPNKIATFTKGLVHDRKGEVDPKSYAAFKEALTKGTFESFEKIPMGNSKRLVNPLAGLGFMLEGGDPFLYALKPAPNFNSEEIASQMLELYWLALCRDVPYAEYGQNEIVSDAIEDLSKTYHFKPPHGQNLTPTSLFRGLTPENPKSPYISQFLWKNIQNGACSMEQRMKVPVSGMNYIHTFDRWLNIQRGAPSGLNPLGSMTDYELSPTPRYILNGRDLGEYVHRDQTYVPFLNACLSLLGSGAARDLGNPYRRSSTQDGFCTFGGPHILDLLARVANAACKVSWYQKWFVHLHLRPEAFGGRTHLVRTKKADYPVSPTVLNSPALDKVFSDTGTYLLPQAYPEGSPLHPAYPSGHSIFSGACATVLKAYFDEEAYIRAPVVPDAQGQNLMPYKGEALTIGGEINKLADNIGMGRMTAGIHWRCDHLAGLHLGEAVAIDMLKEAKECFTETHGVFTLTKFDKTTIMI